MLVVGIDELNCFVGEAVRQVFALRASLQTGHIPERVAPFRSFIGMEVRCGLTGSGPAHVQIEPLPLGEVGSAPQVPLPEVPGRVPRLLQGLRQRELPRSQMVHVIRREKISPLPSPDPIGDVQAGRVFAGEEAGPSRRTYGAGGISLREAHPGGCQLIDIRCEVERTAERTQVTPPQVVNKEEDEVRGAPPPRLPSASTGSQTDQRCPCESHPHKAQEISASKR